MQVRLSFSFLLFSALLLLTLPAFSAGDSAPSGEGVSPRCEAAIDKAAGNYSRCLLKATAMYGKQGQRGKKFLAKQERCEINFNRRVSLAQDRYGEDQCTPYVSAIADRTVSYTAGVASEASGLPAPEYLFIQNSDGAVLTGSTLTLTGISPQTGWFTDRPYREAGQIPTEVFLALWDEDENSFADDPPNAAFTCTVNEEVVNHVVELTMPLLVGDELTYTVQGIGDSDLPTEATCDQTASLFIDNVIGSKSCMTFADYGTAPTTAYEHCFTIPACNTYKPFEIPYLRQDIKDECGFNQPMPVD